MPISFKSRWRGEEVLGNARVAASLAVVEVARDAADMARSTHPFWENDTYQEEASVFNSPKAHIAEGGRYIWADWGVRDTQRFRERGAISLLKGNISDVTTRDVALFLEFGTKKMSARPWLYPAWDTHKVRLPGVLARIHAEITAGEANTRDLRNTFGLNIE